MAINPIDVPSDKIVKLSHSSLNHYKHGNSPASRLVKVDFAPLGSLSTLSYNNGKIKNNLELKSPYLRNSNHHILEDSVQVVSRVTKERFVHKNGGNMVASFPLASNIYKTYPDELKSKQLNRKILKSVLTLPNNRSPVLQPDLVSDNSEYLVKSDLNRKTKKQHPQALVRKFPRSKTRELESQYCSDIDFQLDNSSTDMKKCGDGKRIHKSGEQKGKAKEKVKPHDVWAVLRNINRFQFQTTPQLSEDSFIVRRRKRNFKRRNNRNDMRVFETRCTEEIALISSYEVEKSPTASHCSSFDKITVIDKNQDIKFYKEIEDRPKKKKSGKNVGPKSIKWPSKSKTPLTKRNNFKAITYVNEINDKKNHNVDNIGKFFPHEGETKVSLNNNASVDLGYESKTTENDEDFTCFDLNTTYTATQTSQCSQSKLSDNSGSSKAAAFTKHITHKTVKPKTNTKTKVEPNKQIVGITKVVLSKGSHIYHPRQFDKVEQATIFEPPKINIREVMVTPSSPAGPPKLTKTEINRQLHKYKFPVVILGKDQLRSTFHVTNSEHPQFGGLEKQIWPFMQSWYGIERPTKGMKKQTNHNIHSKKVKLDEVEKKVLPKHNMPKITRLSDKIPKLENKRTPLPLSEILKQTTQSQRKLKPIRQFKDRMLKLLYKNSTVLSVVDGLPGSGTDKSSIRNMAVQVCIDGESNNLTATATKPVTQMSTEKRPWAKAKWASDFIENVIKKIKSGAYYNQDGINKVCSEIPIIQTKEIDIQTDFNDVVTSEVKSEEPMQEISIPGFDNALPPLEIKTMSINEIAVKHCETNIMVHFDVTAPSKSTVSLKSESSFIPINITKSLTKVFKCQTSILNAMLPAELCSILPKILSDIVESGQHLTFIAPSPIEILSLTTISEVPVSLDSLTDFVSPIVTIPTILPRYSMPLELRRLLNQGHYKKVGDESSKLPIPKNPPYEANNDLRLAQELSRNIERIRLFDIDSCLIKHLSMTYRNKTKILPLTSIKQKEKNSTCTALQPCYATNNTPMVMPRPFSIMSLFETMATYINNITGLSCFKMMKTDNNLAIDMNIGKCLSAPKLTFRINNFSTDSMIDCSRRWASSKISVLPDSDETLTATSGIIKRVKLSAYNAKPIQVKPSNNSKVRRRVYVKLYRKCKTSSNTSIEKVTPLNRIKSVDDFFQAVEYSKSLSSVFDGPFEVKIMSLITELKNWTTEINARQALLVILLSNKRETPNLLRYKPMLLQGIAVKRITKATELDTEIEVIERENLNGISKFEGISYIPASIENQDNLYEELCWIAKNTASDYQRPFDHNSEKLLKSLLGKRKQLNPSYLRVMARYVGLGLLKSPGKRQ